MSNNSSENKTAYVSANFSSDEQAEIINKIHEKAREKIKATMTGEYPFLIASLTTKEAKKLVIREAKEQHKRNVSLLEQKYPEYFQGLSKLPLSEQHQKMKDYRNRLNEGIKNIEERRKKERVQYQQQSLQIESGLSWVLAAEASDLIK